MQAKITYQFSNPLWKSGMEGAWHFVSIPMDISKEIREHLQWQEEGWGRMKATVRIGETEWNTSIWFDSKAGCYILPIKSAVRKKLSIQVGDTLEVTLLI
ncbi:DUF1905 domain-containing protein [bacterium SCSIO 12741]|nr:DUF1905 domain-containing protein [bacterium SCSIO 12741]